MKLLCPAWMQPVLEVKVFVADSLTVTDTGVGSVSGGLVSI